MAPRPVFVFAPKIDYRATAADLKLCLEQAQKVFEFHGQPANLRLVELEDYNRFSPESQKVIYAELKRVAGF
jgi:hypothetical protein